jgi:hypothetical protein
MKFDNIELLRENIHRKDLQLIQKIRQKGKEVLKMDFTPIEIMCKFIENSGDPSVFLKAISISHPGHPFCQMLIECETAGKFLKKIIPLEAKFPILFQDNGKKWFSDLFEVSKGCVREEYESEMSALDIAGACA